MKKTSLLATTLLVSATLWAQSPVEKGLAAINKENAEAYIGFLAGDRLEGREAGCRGGHIAAEYIVSNLKIMGITPLNGSYYQPFEAYRQERQKRGRFQTHPDSIAKLKKEVHQKLSMCNILGKIEGKNPDEYVVIGAHYDHLGIDPLLEGDRIYNGADDNASGVSAVLQVAKAFLASGQKPERTVIFAFWDGEEKGLLGSGYFVQECPFLGKIKAYLNYDMIGRNSNEAIPKQVDYFYTEANKSFGDWLKKDIKQYGLDLKPVYHPWDKPVGGSDNSSFAKHGIPIIWYHTNGHPDYHLPGDQVEKLNWGKVVDITKASFLNMWNLANEKEY